MEDEVSILRERNRVLEERIALLEQKLDFLVRKLYGQSSEKLDPDQLELLLDLASDEPGKDEASAALSDELLAEADPTKPKNKRGQRKRPRLPEDLPVVEEKVLVPDAVKADPESYRRIGEEITELLDFEPPRFVCRRIIRPTFAKKRSGTDPAPSVLLTAPLPPLLIEGGMVAPGLLAHIVISKYCDHLPLYRQEQIFAERHEV